MGRDVRLKVKQCEIYQASKHSCPPDSVRRRWLYTGQLWQVVAVDLVGPMPVTPKDNNWILMLTDHFNRWADALAIPDVSAPTVAWALEQHVFCFLGMPEQIHSVPSAQGESEQDHLVSPTRQWDCPTEQQPAG